MVKLTEVKKNETFAKMRANVSAYFTFFTLSCCI